jgi:membrane-anchored protein YejM (alkaline phosphatase superfamily)
MIHPDSVLLITLDSCRFDTFQDASVPNMKALAPLHLAYAPSYFTFGSHSAMFMGFTPGVASSRTEFLNPKYAKLFRLMAPGFVRAKDGEGIKLEGRNIIDGFNRAKFNTIGSGAVSWFNPDVPTCRTLTQDFKSFFYKGPPFSVKEQIQWMLPRIERSWRPVFAFLNVGETHVPYWFEGAAGSWQENPCRPFSETNDAELCRARQRACLEYVDQQLGALLDTFAHATIMVCGDHGDCWGEDGLWEHGVHHEMTLRVPLLVRFKGKPVG